MSTGCIEESEGFTNFAQGVTAIAIECPVRTGIDGLVLWLASNDRRRTRRRTFSGAAGVVDRLDLSLAECSRVKTHLVQQSAVHCAYARSRGPPAKVQIIAGLRREG